MTDTRYASRIRDMAFAAPLLLGALLAFVVDGKLQRNYEGQKRAELNHEIAWLENDVATLSVEATGRACKDRAANVSDQTVTK